MKIMQSYSMTFRRIAVDPRALLILGLITWTFCATWLSRPFPGDQVDDGQYFVAAQSLRDGSGYRLISRPGQPVARKYPPGVSAAVAAALAIAPGPPSVVRDWRVARACMIAAGVGLGTAAFFLLRLILASDWLAVILALAVVFHPAVVANSHAPTADVPFSLISTLFIVLLILNSRVKQEATNERYGRRAGAAIWIGIGCLAAAGWLVRGNGITLVAAALFATLFEKPWRRRLVALTACAGGVLALYVPFAVYVANLAGPRDTNHYAAELAAAYGASASPLSIPLTNLARVPGVLLEAVLPNATWSTPAVAFLDSSPPLRVALSLAVLAVTVAGCWCVIRERRLTSSAWLHLAGTLVIFVVWHYPFDLRFGMPLLPVIFAAAAVGVAAIFGKFTSSQRVQVARFTAALVLLVGGLSVMTSVLIRARAHAGVRGGGRDPQMVSGFDAIRELTEPDAVIVAYTPELIYLNTGRTSAPLQEDVDVVGKNRPRWDNVERRLALVPRQPVYIYGEPPSSEAAVFQLIEFAPIRLAQIWKSDDGTIWLGKVDFRDRHGSPWVGD